MEGDYRFRTLDLYKQALEYMDEVFHVVEKLPAKKSAALENKLLDSATHLVAQIAARSSGQSEIERSFMVDGTLMTLFETVACLDIIRRRKLLRPSALEQAYSLGSGLHSRLKKFKKALKQR